MGREIYCQVKKYLLLSFNIKSRPLRFAKVWLKIRKRIYIDKPHHRPQLLDILAAAQTIPSHKAAMSVLNFGGPIDNPERYLLSLSLATHPSEFILQGEWHALWLLGGFILLYKMWMRVNDTATQIFKLKSC